MNQTTLTGDDLDDGEHEETVESDERADTPADVAAGSASSTTKSDAYTTLAPADQRGGEGCCPWCLASAETFTHHDDGRVGCGYCDTAIPVGVDWYERGEKIAIGSNREV